MTIWRLLRADWLKTRRTPLRWAIFLVPAGYALLLLWYFSSFPASPELAAKIYYAFFEVWTSFLPLLFGVLAGLMCLQEEQAGGFAAMLGLPVSRSGIYASKLVMLIAAALGSLLLAAAILVIGAKFVLGIGALDAGSFGKGALLATAGALALCALHLWLSLAFGFGAGVGIGGAGLLISAIIGATGVGDAIWEAVPWAWPVRLAMHPMAAVALPRVLLYALLLFVFIAVCSLLWFQRWEGRKQEE